MDKYLNPAETVRPQEPLALRCDVIPPPFKEVHHGSMTRCIVGVLERQDGGQSGQENGEPKHPARIEKKL